MAMHEKPLAFRAWYATMAVHGRVLDRVSDELERETGLPAAWFEVLGCLQGTDGRKRMSELASELLLSRGGATRLVARMEEAGHVEREIPRDDRRATFAVITPKGQDALERAMPIAIAAVETHFGSQLEESELQVLAQIMGKVLGVLDPGCAAAVDTAPDAAGVSPPLPPPPS
jgi:DNA-binding MarR family transcriptional regulator